MHRAVNFYISDIGVWINGFMGILIWVIRFTGVGDD